MRSVDTKPSVSHPTSLQRERHGGDNVKGIPHLRRCAKPGDLPAHLMSQFMNDSAHSKQIHTGISSWGYIAVGLASQIDRDLVAHNLSQLEGWKETDVFLTTIPIPLNPPSSQVQAALWSNQYWPSVYRKSNPLGPHPGAVSRGTDELAGG